LISYLQVTSSWHGWWMDHRPTTAAPCQVHAQGPPTGLCRDRQALAEMLASRADDPLLARLRATPLGCLSVRVFTLFTFSVTPHWPSFLSRLFCQCRARASSYSKLQPLTQDPYPKVWLPQQFLPSPLCSHNPTRPGENSAREVTQKQACRIPNSDANTEASLIQ